VSHLEVREGRALARTALEPGQVILVEPPLVTGPGRYGKPVCLSCYSLVDGEYYCAECGWQLCGEQCCGPHATECALLKERGIEATWEDVEEDTFVMDFLGPFRLLVALRDDPRREELLGRDMQTERRQRKFDTRYYQNCETSLMKYIRDTCGVADYSDQHILNALGLFEMYGTNMQNGSKALYPTLTSLGHHCSPNTYSMVLPDGRLVVRASVGIEQGEAATHSLVDALTCTTLRRRELESSFLVDCCCTRCSDPTEFGTCLGGLCSEAHGGAVFLPSQPLKDDGGAWTCSSLPGKELDGAASTTKIVSLTRKCAEGLSQARGSTQTLEFLLDPLVEGEWEVLPRTGQVMLGIKHLLVTAWSNPGLEADKLRTKVTYCEELLSVLAVVHPGRSYPTLMLHYQAASTACALIQAEDSSMVEVGLKHAKAAAEMADQEEDTMYAQLREAALQLKDQITGTS